VSDVAEPFVVYRIDVRNSSCSKWSVSGRPYGLSVTRKNNNVLVTLCSAKIIAEHTTDGQLIREIKLDKSVDYVLHSVQLSSGQFVVCHGSSQHRVCVVNEAGRVVKSYGGQYGSDVGQLYCPVCLSVDSRDNVLVADCINNRLVLLSVELKHLATVTEFSTAALSDLAEVSQSRDTGYQLSGPLRVHVDEQNARLFVGDSVGRALVVRL